MLNTQLLIIDAQNDFCVGPVCGYVPALPIPGAYQDCLRLARLISQAGAGISSVIATLDSHHAIDIAHAHCWVDRQGNTLQPFTPVTLADLRDGQYRPDPNLVDEDGRLYLLRYLHELEQIGRTLILWPSHCEIGSLGHNLNSDIQKALQNWEVRHAKPVNFIQKGENIWTESFSALKAVIPYPGDSATELNQRFLELLSRPDRILVAGQASSHCVKETIEDILRFGDAGVTAKLVILTDCMSPVPGFEPVTERFFSNLQRQGIRLSTSIEIASEQVANN